MIRPCRARRGGFTLVELLVAITIVLLLSSLLLAVGAAMRRSSRRQVCLTAFEHVKDAQAIYFSRRGALVDETSMVTLDTSVTPNAVTSTSWFVTVEAGAPRPLTSMEYFVLMTRMGSSDAFTHLQLLGDLLVPSSDKNGPVIAATGRVCYGTVRIYRTKADALANRDAQYILYDPTPGNPGVPTALAGKLDQTNTGPLQTLVGPWCQDEWDAAAWKTTVNPILPSQPFQWRPHELDYRGSMANYDNTRVPPLRMWYANDAVMPPYLPFSEGMMVSSPGPDGLWAQMDGANAASVAPHGLTNRGITPGTQPAPPFDADPSLLDAGAKDNLYSSQRAQ
jgi:prepilin-type N-terminal cleavage/methylation domain-containing protein